MLRAVIAHVLKRHTQRQIEREFYRVQDIDRVNERDCARENVFFREKLIHIRFLSSLSVFTSPHNCQAFRHFSLTVKPPGRCSSSITSWHALFRRSPCYSHRCPTWLPWTIHVQDQLTHVSLVKELIHLISFLLTSHVSAVTLYVADHIWWPCKCRLAWERLIVAYYLQTKDFEPKRKPEM